MIYLTPERKLGVHRRIAIREGPIAYLMFVQFVKTDVRPLHVSYCQNYTYIYILYIILNIIIYINRNQ